MCRSIASSAPIAPLACCRSAGRAFRCLLDVAWPLLVWFTERIFKEDRWIVEREQEAHDRQGADWNHEVFPVINELRALLRECGAPPMAGDFKGVRIAPVEENS